MKRKNKKTAKIVKPKNPIERITYWYKNLPDKKKYVELITALLSVPVMVTVILINLNNLQQNKESSTKNNTATPVQIIITGGGPQNKPEDRPPTIDLSVTPSVTLTPTITPIPTITPQPTTTTYPTYTPYPTYTLYPTISVASSSAH